MITPIGFLATTILTWADRISALPLLLWLKFDEASGSILDYSGNGYNFTAPGGVIRQQPPAITGSGYSLGANSNLCTRANTAALKLLTGDFTILFWMYPTSNNQLWFYRENLWQIGSNGSGNVYFNMPNWASLLSSSSAIPLNTWTMVAVTRVQASPTTWTYSLSFDGTVVATRTTTILGNDFADTNYIGSTGIDKLDEVVFASVGLTSAQLIALKNAPGA